MPNLVGIGLSQVPTNSMLGGLAYQSPDHASIENLDLKYISQINAETADTAVDIFIYDTSKDSDGGAWRKRTQHTSWYNETLNTATRGSRREFPSVAVIVAEGDYIKIYDGDDPDLPMWMIATKVAANNRPSNYSSVSAYNGIIILGGIYSGVVGGIEKFNFIEDTIFVYGTSGGRYLSSNIGEGRSGDFSSFGNVDSSLAIANSIVNDVAMTVLPKSPIDETTGLPVPTIAVATNDGMSIIKDDGNVYDSAFTSSVNYLSFSENGDRLFVSRNDEKVFTSTITSSIFVDGWGNDNEYYRKDATNTTNFPWINEDSSGSETSRKNEKNVYGSQFGLTIIDETPGVAGTGMGAWITSDYNTGWMHGDIKGAFLSDTDATNVSGSNLIDATSTQWSVLQGTGSVSNPSSDVLRIVDSDGDYVVIQSFTTVVGKQYVFSCNTTAARTAFVQILDSNNNNLGDNNDEFGGGIFVGGITITFTATTTTTRVRINDGSSAAFTVDVENLQVRLAELDRSVNNKGLQVFGTVTKSAVTTGADLVAYSDWSSSNYLRQPYNSDLNAGTGDFYIMCWVKGNELMLWHRGGDGGATDLRCEFPTSGASQNKPRFYMYNATNGSVISFFATRTFDTTTWHHCVWVKDSPTTGKLYIDGVLDSSGTASNGPVDITSTRANFTIGDRADTTGEPFNGSVSLFRFGRSAPSAEQIKKIYEDEKHLFQENAKATLYGSSDAVTALAYDEKTELLHVGTSSGRSDFNGLRRINNTTTAVTTAISAYDGSIAQQ